jgi:hypothetical protein
LPWVLPVVLSLALAACSSRCPSLTVRERAAKAREDFARAVGAYIELVALERSPVPGRPGPRARGAGGAVVGVRADPRGAAALAPVRHHPWDSLSELAEELGVP